jgi:catalase-peroxidase
LAPQRDWEVNNPEELAATLAGLDEIRQRFDDAQSDDKRVSLADLIVLAGCTAIKQAAVEAGVDVEVPFTPGRTDASAEQTDADSFVPLEPKVDVFRNYASGALSHCAEHVMLDHASLLTLTAPELTVLVGGMRALDANHDGSNTGVLTENPGVLTNDFFVNLLDMATVWEPASDEEQSFNGRDRASGEIRWTGSRMDVVFGSNSRLRALAEVYACADAKEKFVRDFVAAWDKVMNLDRFDVA